MLQRFRSFLGFKGAQPAAMPSSPAAATAPPPPTSQSSETEQAAGGNDDSKIPASLIEAGSQIDPYVTHEAVQAAKGAIAPRYPLLSVAVPSVTPDMIMESQGRLIDEIQQTSALSHQDFHALIIPMLRNYAAFVHLLPASENHHHSGQGGLFRHGLEVAFYATLKCEGAVFAVDHTPSARKALEPRWRVAALIGGLLHDLGKPLIDVGALDSTGDLIWSPYTQSLYDWTQVNKLDHYFIQWKPGARFKRHESFTPVAMSRIVPANTMEWLSSSRGHEAIDAMMLALGGSTDPRNPLNAILKSADSASVAKDVAESRTRLAASGMGGVRNLAAQIMRAIYDQVASGQWKLNTPGEVIWMTNEGIFAVVPEMPKQIIEALREKGESSLPNDTTSVIELLGDHGYLVPNVQPNGQTFYTWKIRLQTTYQGKPIEVAIHTVRFTRNDMFDESLVPPKLAGVQFMDANGLPMAPAAAPTKAGNAKAKASPKPALPEGEAPTAAPTVEAAPAPSSATTPAARPSQARKPRQQELLPPDLAEAERDPLLPGENEDPPQEPGPEGTEVDGESAEAEPSIRDLTVVERAQKLGMNIRDVEFNDAQRAARGDWPPGNASLAEEWFASHRPEGEFLLTIAKRIRDKTLVAGRDVVLHEGCSHLKYPEALDQLGVPPLDLLKMFQEKGWAVRDLATPSRGTVSLTIPGQRKAMSAMRLNAHVSAAFEMILPENASSPRVADALPWGPYIDKDVAAHLSDKTKAIESESPWVRLAFQRFVDMRDGVGVMAPTPAPEEWTALMKTFCRMHRIKVSTWLFTHLTKSDNPLLKVQEEDAWANWETARFHLNPEYRGDFDVASTVGASEQPALADEDGDIP